MKKLIILVLLCVSTFTFAQYSMVNYNGSEIETCSATLTLGSYNAGQILTLLINSNSSSETHSKISITQYSFPIGTSLCIYDGSNEAAPLLACYDNHTTGGMIGTEATDNNESGSLYLVFTSGVTGASFSANINCRLSCIDREVNIVSSSPSINPEGYIDVCWNQAEGESFPVMFTAEGTYPELSYPCDDSNNMFYWDFGDGSPIYSGMGLTTVTHAFQARQGFEVSVTIIDEYDCSNTNANIQKVRVSLAPEFVGSQTSISPAMICQGEPVIASTEYIDSSYWESFFLPIVNIPQSLPDGSGICYESDLFISTYESGSIIESIDDFVALHMSICHTYLGDLTMFLICPNGQTVQLGIQGGGGCNLGNPPAEGYWYLITPQATSTMQVSASSLTTLPAGNYASYQSLDGLIGCPLNGNWKLRICDNWAADQGTLFGWWIELNENITPEIWSYEQTYENAYWWGVLGSALDEPINTNYITGTYITTSTPDFDAEQPIGFRVVDNFGCYSDTILYVSVLAMDNPTCCTPPATSAGVDIEICGLTAQANAVITLGNAGEWSFLSGPGSAIFSDPSNPQTQITVTHFGEYKFVWKEMSAANQFCYDLDTISVNYIESPNPAISIIPNICIGDYAVQIEATDIGILSTSPFTDQLDLSTGQFTPTDPGIYTITNTVINQCPGGETIGATTITVHDNIQVISISEECSPGGYDPEDLLLSWEVVGSNGNPINNYFINGVPVFPASSYHEEILQTPANYSFTISDANSCSEIEISGYRDCTCPLYSGTFASIDMIEICGSTCTSGLLDHNADQNTNSESGIFEFIIHTGDFTPLAYSSDANFCINDFAGSFNTVYYINAVCGLPGTGGHADLTNSCKSISASIPIIWNQIPIANAGDVIDICGNLAQLSANELLIGENGYWTTLSNISATNSTNIFMPNPWVISNDYGNIELIWHLYANNCTSTDTVIVNFKEIPQPNAGDDYIACGNIAVLCAEASISGSTGYWTANGLVFSQPNSFITQAWAINASSYSVTFTETANGCSGSDEIICHFMNNLDVNVSPGIDTVCGLTTNIQVFGDNVGSGYWVANLSGTNIAPVPYPNFSPFSTSPAAAISHLEFPSGSDILAIDFLWVQGEIEGEQCYANALKTIVFTNEPVIPTCPEDIIITDNEPFNLSGALPSGGYYSGEGVVDNVFYQDGLSGSYEITYTNEGYGNCQQTCSFIILVSTAVNNPNTATDIYLYPNPNDGRFTLLIKNLTQKSQCSIYNISGKEIFSTTLSETGDNSVNLDLNLVPGMYFIKIINEDLVSTLKMIVE